MDSALPLPLVSLQLPTRESSSSRSELSSAPFWGRGGGGEGVPPLHVCAPDFQFRSHVCVAAPCSHACARATHVCPTRCQPSTEASWPPLAPGVDCRRVGLFSLHVLGSEKKKKSPNELPLGRFSLHFFLPRCLQRELHCLFQIHLHLTHLEVLQELFDVQEDSEVGGPAPHRSPPL